MAPVKDPVIVLLFEAASALVMASSEFFCDRPDVGIATVLATPV